MQKWEERLRSEQEHMEELRSRSEFIDFVTAGDPPDRYTVTFTCKGLMEKDGKLVVSNRHRVLIYLHRYYPSVQPQITWITPIYHPNVLDKKVCLGKSWSPAMMLDDLCLELGAIIQYKTFNLDDPLNGNAARFINFLLKQEPEKFPVDTRNLLGPLIELELNVEE